MSLFRYFFIVKELTIISNTLPDILQHILTQLLKENLMKRNNYEKEIPNCPDQGLLDVGLVH
jgi:hypothetical protein